MSLRDCSPAAEAAPDHEDLAAQAFARRRLGSWTDRDEADHAARLDQDAVYADAFRRVEASWSAVGEQATSAELMALREQALARARRANARRWMRNDARRLGLRRAAAAAAAVLMLVAAFQLLPFGYRPGEYRTRIGEQRIMELDDHSHVAFDAATRLRVRFSNDARIVQLLEGQAQFSVARDPARPFKVEVGDRTIVALGTVFNVQYIDDQLDVATLEGKVAVLAQAAGPASVEPSPPTLSAGEALHVRQDGHAVVIVKADLKAATAWREGKVVFHSEPLGEAVRRLNRYSRLRIEVADPALAAMQVSGVFETGDAHAFVEAVQAYLPAVADHPDSNTVRLRLK